LGLYVFAKAKNPIEKQHNQETMHIAEAIRANRHKELNQGAALTALERREVAKAKALEEMEKADFLEYFRRLAYKRHGSNHDNWMSMARLLEGYTGGSLSFGQLTEGWCEDLRRHLLHTARKPNGEPLAQNTACGYFNKFKAALKQAWKDGKLPYDLNARVQTIKQGETHREYLSLEELQALADTECEIPVLKRAALFSALTGLRFGDIERLTWEQVRYDEANGHHLWFRQQKTKGAEAMPISEGAAGLLGKSGTEPATERVFAGLYYSGHHNDMLKLWVSRAGVKKKITFHNFRHTFATLQLSLGTDIYTVSKMLGHRELKTTQVYAKIVDASKRAAADKIKLEF
jgi:integrase